MNPDSPLTENDVRADRAQRREQEHRAEVDRLRAELAETRAELDSFAQLQREYAELINRLVPAGDALAAAADVVIAGGVEWMQAEGTLIRHREEWWSVRGDAPAESPAVGLPVTLSSPDDVAAGPPPRFERGFYRLARDISIKSENWHLAAGTEIEITHVVRPSQDYAVVSARRWPARVVPFAVLTAAGAERIEAARGETR